MIVLYFYRGRMAPDEVAEAKRLGARTRDALAVTDRDFIERCDWVAGAVPEKYQHIPRITSASATPAETLRTPDPLQAKRGRKRKTDQ